MSATATRVLVEDQPDNPGLHVAIGVPAEGPNVAVPALASNSAPPEGISFSAPADFADGLPFGDLGPGQYRGLYVELTIAPGTPQISDGDFFTLWVRSETA
jgi:hypothetical protein